MSNKIKKLGKITSVKFGHGGDSNAVYANEVYLKRIAEANGYKFKLIKE